MKNYIAFILILLTGAFSLAQTQERIRITGTIEMPPGDDPRGISVFNLNTKTGTVSNNKGEFRIAVAEGDSLRVSSLQFQPFTIVIDEGVMQSRELNISINEAVNVLPEVVVTPYDLTGNVRVDVERLQVVQLPDTLNAMEVSNTYFESETGPNYQTPPKNLALGMTETRLVDGLNFANIFKELFMARKRDQIARVEPASNTELRELYEDAFFQKNLGLEIDEIDDFLLFIDREGIAEPMLKQGGELELIEFLIEKSKRYKKLKGKN